MRGVEAKYNRNQSGTTRICVNREKWRLRKIAVRSIQGIRARVNLRLPEYRDWKERQQHERRQKSGSRLHLPYSCRQRQTLRGMRPSPVRDEREYNTVVVSV